MRVADDARYRGGSRVGIGSDDADHLDVNSLIHRFFEQYLVLAQIFVCPCNGILCVQLTAEQQLELGENMKEQDSVSNAKKKVLFVTNTMGRAGAEKCLQALLELLDPEKYDLSVYSIINRGELYSDMPDYVRILNKNPCTKSVLDSAGLAAIGRQILWSLLKKCSFITYIPYFFRVLFHQIKVKRLDFSKLFWMLLARNAKRFDEEYDLAVAFIEGAATYYVADYVKSTVSAALAQGRSSTVYSSRSRRNTACCLLCRQHTLWSSSSKSREMWTASRLRLPRP